MKGKHEQKNFGAIGALASTPLSLKTQGGGGEGGAGGCRIQGPGPAAPPLCYGPSNTVAYCGTLLLCQILPFQISPFLNPLPNGTPCYQGVFKVESTP